MGYQHKIDLRLSIYKQQNFIFFALLEAGKSQIEVAEDLMSGENSFSYAEIVPSRYILMRWKARMSYESTDPISGGRGLIA